MRIPLKFSRRGIMFLFAALILLGVALVVFWFHQSVRLKALEDDLHTQQQQLNDASALASKFEDEQTGLAAEQDKLKQLEGNLSTKEYIPTLLQQVQNLATQTNNRLMSIKPVFIPGAPVNPPPPPPPATNNPPTNNPPSPPAAGPPPPPADASKNPADSYDKYSVDIEIQGQYKDVMRFLFRLTSFPKIVSVDQFILRNGAGGGEGTAAATMNLTAYVLKES